jgi:hypothetical protein
MLSLLLVASLILLYVGLRLRHNCLIAKARKNHKRLPKW